MQKWEYKIIEPKGGSQELNELGKQGWELAVAVRDDDSNETRFIFKRPVQG